MSFEDALATARAPSVVGDVRLRYERQLLIGESRQGSALRHAPEAMFIGGVGAAAGAVALLVMPQDASSAPLAIAFALLCAALLVGGLVIERRSRRPRRFVLNFATETLRTEQASLFGRRTEVVGFDAVTGLSLVRRPRGWDAAVVHYRPPRGQPRSFVLIDRIQRREDPGFLRAFRLLEGAFGLGERPSSGPAEDEDAGPDDRFEG